MFCLLFMHVRTYNNKSAQKYIPFSTIATYIQCDFSVVNGGWSSWTEGSCSKACDGGIRIDTRTCNNPTRTCEGLPCKGSSTREKPCNEFCCPGKFISYICILKWQNVLYCMNI